MSQIPSGIANQVRLSGLDVNDRAWQATTGAAIEAERERAAHTWSADGFWTTMGKGAGEFFSLGYYDAGPRSGISAMGDFLNDNPIVSFADLEPTNFRSTSDRIGEVTGTDGAGRLTLNRDQLGLSMTASLRRAARYADRSDRNFTVNEAKLALYGTDDQGQLFDEGTLLKLAAAGSDYELATRRAVAMREREAAGRKQSMNPAMNFAVSFVGGFYDPAILASGMAAGAVGNRIGGALLTTEIAPGIVLPGTANVFKSLATRGIIAGGENVAQSVVLADLAGQDYNWNDAMRDMAFGATFGTAFGTFGPDGAISQAAEIRMASRRFKEVSQLMSMVNRGAELTDRGAMFFQHVPGLTRTSTMLDIAAAEMVRVQAFDHVEAAGGGRSDFGWLVGRKATFDGIGEVTVTGIDGRDVVGTIDGREVRMGVNGVAIDRFAQLQPGTRVRLDDGTLGTIDTPITESTPFADATRVPRRGDATTTVRVVGDDGKVHNLNPDELLARGGVAAVRRGQVVFDPANAQRAIVAFGKARDASTLAHEPGHVFRRTLRDIDSVLADKMNEHYGQNGDGWTVDAEERFARDFEQYVKEGKAPTPELQTTFQRFAAWLADLWESIGGNKAELTDIQRQAFGSLLDSNKARAINGELGSNYANVRAQLRRAIGENHGSKAVESLMLANAKAWSRATGRNIDEYFDSVIAGFTGSLRNPFHAPIRRLPGRVTIAKGRPSGFINQYIEGMIQHIDMPGRAQREAQLLGLNDPNDARAKWRAGLAEKRVIDDAARVEDMENARREGQESETIDAMAAEAARDAYVRERMVVVGHAIDRDGAIRSAFTPDRVAQINADIGIKARSWLFGNNSDVVKVNPRQREQVRYALDGTITVNHAFVHMHAPDRMAAFHAPLMRLEFLRDAIDSGIRPDSPDLVGFIESYGFDKAQANAHAIGVERLFRQIDRRTGSGAKKPVTVTADKPAPKLKPEDAVATVERAVDTLNNSEPEPTLSFSRVSIEQRLLQAADSLRPMTATDAAIAEGKANNGSEYYDETSISFEWPDKLPTEIVEALQGQPKHIQEMFTAGNGRGRGADTMNEIGVDAMIEIAREGTGKTSRWAPKIGDVMQGYKIDVIAKGELARKISEAKDIIASMGEPNASLLSWMHDNPGNSRGRMLLKPQEIGTNALLRINDKTFEVRDSKEGFRELVGINGNDGVRIPLDSLEHVPADGGSFIQGNRWRGPKPVKDVGGADVLPEAVEIPPAEDFSPLAVLDDGMTAPTPQLEWDPIAQAWLDPIADAGFGSSLNELAQDVLDLTDTLKSEDRSGALPLGGAKGQGLTGGRAARVEKAPRTSRVAILKGFDHPLLNVVTNAIFQDPLLDSAAKRSNASAEQFDSLHMHTKVDGYLRQMYDHVTGAATAAGIGRINIPKRMKFETEFREKVGRLVRDRTATSATIADPHLRAAVETTRKTLREIGQLGKDNFVKNFDKFALNDNYLTRQWAFDKLHAMEKAHPGEVSNLFARAVMDAQPALTPAEASVLGDLLRTKLFTHGKEAGIDRNAFAAGFTNREHLLRVLKENGVNQATAVTIADKVAMDKDNTATLSVAKRRTLINEKATIRTASGATIGIEDLLNNDAMAIVHGYGQQVIAEAAMTQVRRQIGAKVGMKFDTDSGLMEFLSSDMRNAGYSQAEVNKAMYLVETGVKRLRGIALEDSGTWTDNLWRVRQGAAIAGNGAFGIPAAFELGHAITRLGVRATLANMPAVYQAWRALRTGNVNDPALKAMLYTIGVGHDSVSARYFGSWEHATDPYQTNREGKLAKFDKVLSAAARLSRFISGVPQITEFSRLMAANGVQHKLVQQALSGKQPSARRLAWLGMDQARWDNVAKMIQANHKKGPGGLVDVQLDGGGWTDAQAKHDYIEAVRSQVNTIIQEGGIGASHPWLETEAGKVIFQFRQFGIMAYQRQTLAQYQIGDSDAIGRGMIAAVPFGMMQYMAATYLNSLGRNDREEYLDKMLTPDRMAIAAFSRASFSSIGPVIYDSFAATAGFETLGGFRSSGLESDPLLGNPTFSIITAGRKGLGGGLRAMIDPDYDLSDDNIRGIRTVVPFSRLPGTSLMWNQILNQTPAKSINRVDEP